MKLGKTPHRGSFYLLSDSQKLPIVQVLIAESEEFDAKKGIEDKSTSKIDKIRADIIFFI